MPPPQVWRAQATPALRWLGPIFNACTRQAPQTTLLVDEKPLSGLDLSGADFTFSLQPLDKAAFTAVLGRVELAVVVNPANPLAQLDANGLEAVFSGQAAQWADLAQNGCPSCAKAPQGAIQPYIYPAGDDVGQFFAGLLPGLPARLPSAILAPDPAAVRQAVAADPQGIGYLPAAWVDSTVRSITLTGFTADQLRFPLLLSTAAEPQGEKRSWVLCVQDSLK